jgi:hypothetical protein
MSNTKSLYRCEIYFTGKYEGTAPVSNIFVRALTMNDAMLGAKQKFNDECYKNGFKDASFTVEVYASSEAAVAAYRQGMKNRTN